MAIEMRCLIRKTTTENCPNEKIPFYVFGTKTSQALESKSIVKKLMLDIFLCILLSSWVDVPFHSKTWLSCMSMRCRKLPSIRCQLLMYFLCCLSYFAHFMWISSLNILSSLFLLWISDFSHWFAALEFDIWFDCRKMEEKKIIEKILSFREWRKSSIN